MKKFIPILIAMIVIAGCIISVGYLVVENEKNPQTPSADSKVPLTAEAKAAEILTQKIAATYGVDKIEITESVHRVGTVCISFLFKNNNDLMEGLACLEGDDIRILDVVPVHQSAPFTHHEKGGQLSDGTIVRMVTGYINDPAIKEIRVAYKNDNTVVYRIQEGQKTFLEYSIGYIPKFKQIVAIDENLSMIYRYGWDVDPDDKVIP